MENELLIITLIVTAIAAIFDLRFKKIPNKLTIPLILVGLIINTVFFHWYGLKDSLLGLVVPTLILLIPFAMGGIGAGDVKLIAGIGAMGGLNFVIFSLLYGSICGGLMALCILLYRKQLKPVLFNVACSLPEMKTDLFSGRGLSSDSILTSGIKFPYGLAIFLGALTTYLIG